MADGISGEIDPPQSIGFRAEEEPADSGRDEIHTEVTLSRVFAFEPSDIEGYGVGKPDTYVDIGNFESRCLGYNDGAERG